MKLILASSSPYRRALLARLKIPFEAISPDVDETPQPNETPEKLVERLSRAKARKVATDHRDALVIGSDQVAVYNGQIVGKPHGHDNAVAQLREASGRTVMLYTGLALLNAATGKERCEVVPYRVTFRKLTDELIEGLPKGRSSPTPAPAA